LYLICSGDVSDKRTRTLLAKPFLLFSSHASSIKPHACSDRPTTGNMPTGMQQVCNKRTSIMCAAGLEMQQHKVENMKQMLVLYARILLHTLAHASSTCTTAGAQDAAAEAG
jgi:hypothetical protein